MLNPESKPAIQEAALRPPIHRERWEQYGDDLPPEETLRWQLLRRGFTETGFDEFIREYRDTIASAEMEGAPEPEPESQSPAGARSSGDGFDSIFGGAFGGKPRTA